MPAIVYTFSAFSGKTGSFRTNYLNLLTADATQALITPIAGGQLTRETRILAQLTPQTGLPATDTGNVGDGARFYIRDQVTAKLGFFTLPIPDMTVFEEIQGSDGDISMTSPAAVVNFIADVNANFLSEDGNAVVVESVKRVSRNR